MIRHNANPDAGRFTPPPVKRVVNSKGVQPRIRIGAKRPCLACKGTGSAPKGGDCPTCLGDGWIHPGDPGEKEQQHG
jgi:DnaJ-class molecular chaperone